MSDMLKSLVEYVTAKIVDKPETVRVTISETEQAVVVKLYVDPEDRGKVIGREGKMARVMRTLLHFAAIKLGKRAVLEIEESA